MIIAGVGTSSHSDSFQAGYEACSQAMQKGGIDKPDLTIVFSSVKFAQDQVVKGVRQVSGGASLVGCSGAGEITNEGPSDKVVAVMAIKSDTVSFTTVLGKGVKENAREAGKNTALAVREKAGANALAALVMFPDVLAGNGADTVRGALDALGEHALVVGGAAGDDFLFTKTFQYEGEEVASGSIAAVGITGNCALGLGVRHGWMPIGLPMKATKSDGAVLKELDGKPAVKIYEEYFEGKTEALRKEPLARMAITYPLGIKVEGYDEYLIRDPITVGEDGSLTCAAEIPEGSEVRLMIGSKERAIEAAEDAAKKLMRDFSARRATPKALFMFNCIAREKLFAQEAKDEISAVMNIIGRDVPLLGFYTYGEEAPLGGEIVDETKRHSQFYNETIVIFGIGE